MQPYININVCAYYKIAKNTYVYKKPSASVCVFADTIATTTTLPHTRTHTQRCQSPGIPGCPFQLLYNICAVCRNSKSLIP